MALSRRQVLRSGAVLGAASAVDWTLPAWARGTTRPVVSTGVVPASPTTGPVDLTVDALPVTIDGRAGHAVAVNGAMPGPLVRLREGDDAVVRVMNRLGGMTSVHWHGLLLPAEMDGVPGVSFGGIAPGATFTYRFPLRQSGTYWAHAHDANALMGMYFPVIIDPKGADPIAADREHVVMLADWSFEHPMAIIKKLKRQGGYYNYQRRTALDFVRDVRRDGLARTLDERAAWSRMRMDPTDFADVTAHTYTYLVNGHPATDNWTALFRAGERVRLRCISAAAMTYFDVRIPGLRMTVVQADGQNVRPVDVDELRMAPGETYDVLVQPADRAYTLFAESMDRGGFTRATLAPRAGMTAPVPARRPRPLRTMKDMGMAHAATPDTPGGHAGHEGHTGHGALSSMRAMDGMMLGPSLPGSAPHTHDSDTHGPGNAAVPMMLTNRLDEPGAGFEASTGKVLVYTDLVAAAPPPDGREPTREIELHITGNMERYMWGFDGKPFADAREPIQFRYGERLRLFIVNDTMMEHPIHLHGMWMQLENGAGEQQPLKHTLNVKPAERLSVAITADAPGTWALHCHLLLHMEMGMFRLIDVTTAKETSS